MCIFKDKQREIVPDWITQTRKKVCKEERYAASLHRKVIKRIKNGELPEKSSIYGDLEFNEYWVGTHEEAAWYAENPLADDDAHPLWVVQTREEVAQAQRDAAAIHYAYMIWIEEGKLQEETAGSHKFHEHWWRTHQESAWYMENAVTLQLTGSEVGVLMSGAA